MLRLSGWQRGVSRDVPWDELPLPCFPVAKGIVNEFYGVTVGSSGLGRAVARVKLTFEPRIVSSELSSQLGLTVYHLGEVDVGHAEFFVAENGAVYMWAGDTPLLVADEFDDALQRMLLGLRYEE